MTEERLLLSSGAAWVAGEASGDYLASLVLPGLARSLGWAPQFGVGGEKMKAAGLDAWWPIDRLSVRGYVEVLKKIPGILALRAQVIRQVSRACPRVFIGVDAPDFNLGVELEMKRRGIPTVHFVSPAIWAWRPGRISRIRQAVDHMLLVFPFEEEIYRREGVPATYIGHPLAGIIPMLPDTEGARRRIGIDPQGEPVFAVLPGSRADEIASCGPVFLAACEKVVERLGAGRFLLPAVDGKRRRQVGLVLSRYPALAGRMTVVTGSSHLVLEASDAVLAASGTATLEAALYKKPVVVGYAMPGLTAILMKKKGLVHCVSLPNILLGEPVVPEFLHYFCSPDAIACSLIDQLGERRRSELLERFAGLHASLLRPTAELACAAIESVMRRD